MAIQISYTAPSGITSPNAYARISGYQGNKDTVQLTVLIYKDAAARLAKAPMGNFKCTSPYLPNVMKDGYAYLKTLPEFSAGLDV